MSQPSLPMSAMEAGPSLSPVPVLRLPSRLLAAALLQLSRKLARAARSLALASARHQRPKGEPLLEFYAEAGAPEGALYADGKLVGYLSGVSRL